MDPPLVAGAEPALEISTPLIVGGCHRCARPSLVERATAPFYRRHQTCALENGPDRGGRRPGDLGGLAIKNRQKLARPQIRKPPPRRDHLRGNRTIRGLPTLQRRMRAVLEPGQVAALFPAAPFVKRVAANPVAPAQLRDAPVPPLVLQKHPNTFFHPTGLSKWHRRALPSMHSETCRGSSRFNLSGIYSVCTPADPRPRPLPLQGYGIPGFCSWIARRYPSSIAPRRFQPSRMVFGPGGL